jgi:putative Holliday junction resolvase
MNKQTRVLGLDYGDQRIGIAVADATLSIASPLITLASHNVWPKLLQIIKDYNVDTIIVGKPVSMSGLSNNSQLLKVEKFAEKLIQITKTKIIFWDERLSTSASQKYINEAKMSKNKQKQIIDKVAASFILQGWLDYKSYKKYIVAD